MLARPKAGGLNRSRQARQLITQGIGRVQRTLRVTFRTTRGNLAMHCLLLLVVEPDSPDTKHLERTLSASSNAYVREEFEVGRR